MPSGIVMQSSSVGATQEAIEKVLSENGYEPDKPAEAAPEAPVEPKREDFATDEEFETAQEEFETNAEEQAEKEEEERQKKQEATRPHLTRRQRAIDKATKQLQEDLRKANERLAALEGGAGGAGGGKKAEPAVKVPEAPKREAFKTDAEFEEALFDHRYKMRRAKEEAERQVNAQQERLKTNFQNYQSSVAEFKETHDDWDEVIAESKIPIQESVYFAIHELENGPAVAYYLGKHPVFATKLAEMSPFAAVMEVGRLAARLKTGAPEPGEAGSKKTTQKPKARIPEPVKPLSTSPTSSTLTSKEAAAKGNYRAFKAAQARGV